MPELDLRAAAAGSAVTAAHLQAAPAVDLPAAPAEPLLRLRYGGWPWAVAGGSVREVVGTERLQRNPRPAAGSPYGWLLGESEEIPVYLPAELGPANSVVAVVVLQPAAGPPCGLGVEAVDDIRQASISCLRHLPEQAASRDWVFPRVVLWDDGLALEIAPEAVPHLAASARPAEAGGARIPAAGGAHRPAAGAPRFGAWLPGPSSSTALFAFTLPGALDFALPGVGALDFALPAAQVVEALSAVMPRPVPGALEPLLGLLAWRGEALPVLDLARAIGLPPVDLARAGALPPPVDLAQAVALPPPDLARAGGLPPPVDLARAVGPPPVDLARAGGLPPPASTPPRGASFAHAVVARAAHSRQLLVFPVERMAGVRPGPFPQPALAGAPYPGARRILGAFGDGERMLVVPDLDGVLARSPVALGASGAASRWR